MEQTTKIELICNRDYEKRCGHAINVNDSFIGGVPRKFGVLITQETWMSQEEYEKLKV
jgi:hypothetical protein